MQALTKKTPLAMDVDVKMAAVEACLLCRLGLLTIVPKGLSCLLAYSAIVHSKMKTHTL